VIGAVVVNWAKTGFSEHFPSGWLYLQGALFILVMAYAPRGLAGLWQSGRERAAARRDRPSRVATSFGLAERATPSPERGAAATARAPT
jgi:urea transport system permease protein